MTNERWKELQTEIAKLKEKDDRTTERVAKELDIMAEAYKSEGKAGIKKIAAEMLNDPPQKEIEIPCSLEQDMEWANESENIQ